MTTQGAPRLTLLPLTAAVFFTVSGGAYGLEDMIQKVGFSTTIQVLLILPIVWSLPTVLMLAELNSALPSEGGYYVWVRRALGPFWGFMEAWLSLVASVFDMAIYPTLFVLYLGKLWPLANDPQLCKFIGLGLIVGCTIWNLRGAPAVGRASILFAVTLLAPFAVFSVLGLIRPSATTAVTASPQAHDLVGAIVIGMWNFMGWDNVSTLAEEVEKPQQTYPLALGSAVVLVTCSYLLPVIAASHSGIAAEAWTVGTWVDAAAAVGGPWLAWSVILGGMLCGLGMLNALTLAYSRLPMVLACDGLLPKLLARQHPATQVPYVALGACAVAWILALGNDFERLLSIDVLCYGAALVLEFASLIVLRIREPDLTRPCRVPGGWFGLALLTLAPVGLLGVAIVQNIDELRAGIQAPLAMPLLLLGPCLYWIANRRKQTLPSIES